MSSLDFHLGFLVLWASFEVSLDILSSLESFLVDLWASLESSHVLVVLWASLDIFSSLESQDYTMYF